ncbi:MAG: DoxX family protein [Parcubacteria group bacterium]|nr:DoxX family protein [Parcubacteria group bacterium]
MPNQSNNSDLGLLFLRVSLAVVFIAHGFVMYQSLASSMLFFASLGLSPLFVYLVILLEIVGGLLMIFGYLVNFAGSALAIVMLGEMYFVSFQKGFLNGFEYDLVLLLVSLAVALLGSGKYSVDYFFGRQ